jgi:hypothetical protein
MDLLPPLELSGWYLIQQTPKIAISTRYFPAMLSTTTE